MPRPSPYTPEIESLIIKDYQNGKSTHELVAAYGGDRKAVALRLERAGITMRTAEERQHRLPCREDAFANAENDDEAAYWVGMLMSDGCISTGRHSTWVVLVLGVRDEAHVEAFRSFLDSEHKILHVPESRKTDGFLRGAMCDYRVASKRMASDLARYGVVSRKSKTAEVKSLEGNRHFWRGVVDGDGSLGRSSRQKATHNSRPLLQVVGSEFLMRQFETFAHNITGTQAKTHRSKSCWGVSLTSGAAADMIAHLYTDCTVALARKWKLAHELLCEWALRARPRVTTGRRATF